MTIRWSDVQGVYSTDLQDHWTRSQSLGLDCPLDVFEQLFFDHHGDDEFAGVVRFIDWAAVEWQERALSGVALRRVAVPRPYQHAVDEARYRTLAEPMEDLTENVAEKGQVAGQHLVQDDAQAIEVAALIGIAAVDLLRTNVIGSSGHEVGAR